MNETQEMKPCPFCGCEISQNVKKCKHCGEWLVIQEKDKPKASWHLSVWIEGIIVLILIVVMFFVPYNDIFALLIMILYAFLHLYFWPSLIADKKRTDKTLGVFLLNLLLGGTVVGWIGAMIWAVSLPDLSKNAKDEDKDEEDEKMKAADKKNMLIARIACVIFIIIVLCTYIHSKKTKAPVKVETQQTLIETSDYKTTTKSDLDAESTAEEDYSRFVNKSQQQENSSKTVQQSVQQIQQPVAPQPKSEQVQPQNHDVDNFMN